ncbi:MAG: aspartate 1-decarboxylase [Pirellulales bacterium]
MIRTLLKSKIHRATVTQADLEYVGSITIDEDLMVAADIVENEQVDIYNITSGNRLTTYAIPGKAGTGVICINGAAAHLAQPDDLVIIASYATYEEAELIDHQPTVIMVDEQNRQVESALSSGSPKYL